MVERPRVSPEFGVERRLEPDDPAAEPGHHIGDDVIGADAQPLAGDLQRQMAIAEMPGDAQHGGAIGCLDLEDRLGRCPDAQITAAVEFEAVAVGEMICTRQIEQKRLAGIGDQSDAAAVPIEISQRNTAGRSVLRPVPSAVNGDRSAHGLSSRRPRERGGPRDDRYALAGSGFPLARE